LSSMGMGPKKSNMKVKQSGITGAIAGSGASGGESSGSGRTEVGSMLRNLHSDLKSNGPPPPGFDSPPPPPPPGFAPSLSSSVKEADPISNPSKNGNNTMEATSSGIQNKKPTNWTKIGGVTHTIEPLDLVEPTGPVSSIDYPSLPPSSSDDSNWNSVKKKSNSSSGKSFASATSKQVTSVNASVSISASVSKDVKTNNDAKAKKGIKNQKKVRQDLMSLMTGK